MDNNEKKQNIDIVMKDLEKKVNPIKGKGLEMLNDAIKKKDPDILLSPMIEGAKEFENRVGRPMTYSEMRSMWG